MTINYLLQNISNYIVFNSWFLFLSGLILSNAYLLWKIFQQQKRLIPKGRLIHFIYQSIATTDIQVAQIVQQLTDIKQQQEEITLKLSQWKDKQKENVYVNPPSKRTFGKNDDTVYVNAIRDLQMGKSLDEIALYYQLSRDELEILAAVYAPKNHRNVHVHPTHTVV